MISSLRRYFLFSRFSLYRQLLAWLLIPLALMVIYNAINTIETTRLAASTVTDRLLQAAARVLSEQVHVTEDNRIEAIIMPSALGVFASVGRDRALYKIISPRDELIAGYPDVPLPPQPPTANEPVFFSARFRDQDIRAIAVMQPLLGPVTGSAQIIVGVTLREEDRFANELWSQSALQQVILVLIAAAFTIFGLRRGLSPLIALGDRLRQEGFERWQPIDPKTTQSELSPLVEALNEAVAQINRQIDIRRRFIDDAAHQLRTPLTLLKMQVSAALRAQNIAAKDETLQALSQTTDNMAHVANQLLTMARTGPDGAGFHFSRIDLAIIAERAIEKHFDLALHRQIDLGLEAEPAPLYGDAAMLSELIANLIDNALAYTQADGKVTLSVHPSTTGVALRLEDNGPGIPPSEYDNVFKRFYRMPGTQASGSGLGLSIVREITQAHQGMIWLEAPQQGPGLIVRIFFPNKLPDTLAVPLE